MAGALAVEPGEQAVGPSALTSPQWATRAINPIANTRAWDVMKYTLERKKSLVIN